MFRSIRSRLIVSVGIMAALVAALVYFSSVRIGELEATLDDLQSLQEFKSHVLIPQKDMNQFLAAMDTTVLQLELGEAEGAQEAYDESVDAEQDISAEFALLEESGSDELLAAAQKAHREWEVATDVLKTHAEQVAKESGMTLLRPVTEPTKTVDAHSLEAVSYTKKTYVGLSSAELEEILDDDDRSPVETADNLIDGLEDSTDEILAEEKAAGEASLKAASKTILFGSLGVLGAIVVIGLTATAAVSRPMGMLKEGAEHISAGELDFTFKDVPANEIGSVIHSVERMSVSLKDRIRTLEEMAGVVLLTGDEISSAASTIEPKTPQAEEILAKSQTLKDLVGQILASTKK